LAKRFCWCLTNGAHGPVLLIYFPGQSSGIDVNPVQPELLEHDIVADVLLGKMNNPEALTAFLARQGH
jgi:hypothetical protein